MDSEKNLQGYWKENLKYLFILLTIWAFTAFGLSIIFVDQLDKFKIAGFKLGFWFAQQGSIFIFVIIIFIYVHLMNRLDKKYGVKD